MEISIFLAQWWGWFLAIIGLILLLRQRVVLEEMFKLLDDKACVLISGYLALIVGLVTVVLHNVWIANWKVVITIFGWLSLIKGIGIIGFPDIFQKLRLAFKNRLVLTKILSVICIFLGIWLIWMSY